MDKKVCNAFGVIKEKTLYGKLLKGISRTTFLLDGKGRISKVFEDVKPAIHAEEVLAALRAL